MALRGQPSEEFNQSLESFLRLGGLGMRVTRAAGGLWAKDCRVNPQRPDGSTVLLKNAGYGVRWIPKSFNRCDQASAEAEQLLRAFRDKDKYPAKGEPSPLSYSKGKERQTSAVYFGIVKISDGSYRLLVFEAPHENVLYKTSDRSTPIIEQLIHS